MNKTRRGLSTGSILMLLITGVVILGCALLAPKLVGDISVRVNAREVVVAIDEELKKLGNTKSSITPVPQQSRQTAAPAAQAQPSPTAVATPTPQPKVSFSLTAGGLMNLSLSLQKSLYSDKGDMVPALFSAVEPNLTGDLTLAALKHTVIAGQKASDTNLNAALLPSLRQNGPSTLFIGYSGALTNGVSGLAETYSSLLSVGLDAYGAYTSAGERDQTHIVAAGGARVALLGYSADISNAAAKKTSKEELAFAFAEATLDNVKRDVNSARRNGAQIVIASVYWGKDGASAPTKAQQQLAQGMAEAGVDVILGCRPSAVQRVELLTATRADGQPHQALCAYSLGTLVSASRSKRAEIAGMLMHLTLTYDPAQDQVTFGQMTYTPTYLWRVKENGRTLIRVLPADRPAPEQMDREQKKSMQKCLELIQSVMADGPMTQETGNIN